MMKSIILRPWQLQALQAGRLGRVMVPIALREFGPSDTPGYDWTFRGRRGQWNDVSTELLLAKFRPYVPGSKLAVREAWGLEMGHGLTGGQRQRMACLHFPDRSRIPVPADTVWDMGLIRPVHGPVGDVDSVWRSPATMPLWAARYHITIGDVRPVRVRELSEDEAVECGVRQLPLQDGERGCWWTADVGAGQRMHSRRAAAAFAKTWQLDHGPKHPWDTAWAWSIEVAGLEVST
jgi:hypothetical protein